MSRYTKNMSASERRKRRSGWRPTIEGREEFVRDNAVSLLAEKDAQIGQLRERIRKLETSRRDLRTLLAAKRMP